MGFFRRFGGVVARPAETFTEIREERPWRAPLYFLLLLLPPALLLFIGGFFVRPLILGPYLGDCQYIGWLSVALTVPFVLAVGFISLVLGVLALHPFVFLLGGRRGPAQTLKVLAYSNTPLILGLCFPPALVLTMVWSLVLAVLGLRRVHGLSTVKAVLSMFLPLAGLAALILLARALYAGP